MYTATISKFYLLHISSTFPGFSLFSISLGVTEVTARPSFSIIFTIFPWSFHGRRVGKFHYYDLPMIFLWSSYDLPITYIINVYYHIFPSSKNVLSFPRCSGYQLWAQFQGMLRAGPALSPATWRAEICWVFLDVFFLLFVFSAIDRDFLGFHHEELGFWDFGGICHDLVWFSYDLTLGFLGIQAIRMTFGVCKTFTT